MNDDMRKYINIVEGREISHGEAVYRIKQAAKKYDVPVQELMDLWSRYAQTTDVKELNSMFKKRFSDKKVKVKGGKGSRSKAKVLNLADKIEKNGWTEEVLDMIDALGMQSKWKAMAKPGDMVKSLFDDVNDGNGKVSDKVVKAFFRELADEYGLPSEGLDESQVRDYLDKPLTDTSLGKILSVIDSNNLDGSYNTIKKSIISKIADDSVETSTLRGIGDEIMRLSKKGIDVSRIS